MSNRFFLSEVIGFSFRFFRFRTLIRTLNGEPSSRTEAPGQIEKMEITRKLPCLGTELLIHLRNRASNLARKIGSIRFQEPDSKKASNPGLRDIVDINQTQVAHLFHFIESVSSIRLFQNAHTGGSLKCPKKHIHQVFFVEKPHFLCLKISKCPILPIFRIR